MSIRSRHEDDDRRTGEEREREERRDRSEQEWQAPRRRDSHVNRPRTDLGDSSDSDTGGGRMMIPFGGGDSSGMNLFSGFQRPRSTMGNGLSPGAQYTGQLYASQGLTNAGPLIQGTRGGTYYVTQNGDKRYFK